MTRFAGHKNEKWLTPLDEQYRAMQQRMRPLLDELEAGTLTTATQSKLIELMAEQQQISTRMLVLLGLLVSYPGGVEGKRE